ncbi:DUF4304 domain-containing protein [Kallotenue papyrolyticum]|uniref:DUF4304 domain-containing protein n=1 Tax=Kallotenue papyrolyticum TaxID=1325125 RepID=UPI0009DD1151|nr:DUF4304 domain-containing protein [Kallotenue papyrolyticum]
MDQVKNTHFVDELIKRYLHPELRQYGFTRKARTWNREYNSFNQVINVQTGKTSTHNSGDFTINMGVFVPSVYRAVWGDVPSFVRETDCTVRTRLGCLLDKKVDKWWSFDQTTDIVLIGKEITDLLVNYGLPFLEQFDSLESIHNFLIIRCKSKQSTPLEHIYLAVVKAQLGDTSGAKELFTNVASSFPAWREWALKTATELEIDLEHL